MSANKAIIGLNNGLLPIWNQAIMWNNSGLLIAPSTSAVSDVWIRVFIQENGFENVINKMATIYVPAPLY